MILGDLKGPNRLMNGQCLTHAAPFLVRSHHHNCPYRPQLLLQGTQTLSLRSVIVC